MKNKVKKNKKQKKGSLVFNFGITGLSVLGSGIVAVSIFAILLFCEVIGVSGRVALLIALFFGIPSIIIFIVQGIIIIVKKEDFGKLKAKLSGSLIISSAAGSLIFCAPFVLVFLEVPIHLPMEVAYIGIALTGVLLLFLIVFEIIYVLCIKKETKKIAEA